MLYVFMSDASLNNNIKIKHSEISQEKAIFIAKILKNNLKKIITKISMKLVKIKIK